MNFGRIRQMLLKEFIQIFRDPRARFWLIVPQILQLLLFGYAATFEVRHVQTAVLDLDNSPESRELISRFSASGRFDVVEFLNDQTRIPYLIDRGRVILTIQIHPGFARLLRKGRTAPVQVILDGTNSNTALIALGYINQIAGRFADDYQTDRMQRVAPQLAAMMPRVELEPRPWYNPNLESRWFFVPGVIGSLSLIMVVNLTAFAVVREREMGTLEQIMVTPIRPAEFILGKTLPVFLIGCANVVITSTVALLWFRIPFNGNPAVLALGAMLFLLSMLGVGLLISTVCSTQQQALASSFFFITPAFTLSGFGFPISSMPQVLQWITYLDPMRYFLVVLRGTFIKGVGLEALWPEMLAMATLGLILLTDSVLRFRKSLD